MISELNREITLDDHYDPKLVSFIKSHTFDTIPHLLFYGSPGTGKTQFADTIATHFLNDAIVTNLFEFNASDDRGIDVIRDQIKSIAGSKSLNGSRKIILLDEADFLTNDAQAALRRIMDSTSHLFILTANYEHKLLPAIQNRLSSWYFSGPDARWACEHFKELDPDILGRACAASSNSFREIFHNYDKIKNGEKVVEKSLDLINMSSKDFIDMSWKVNDPSVLIKDLHHQILKTNSKNKAKALIELAEVDYRCSLSTNKYLQLQTGYIKIRNILKD